MTPEPLLRERVRENDALLLTIIEVKGQDIVAKPERVYSRRFEGPQTYDQERLSFVGSPGSWGSVTLKPGELALVFIRYLEHSRRYYQHYWHGHFSVISLHGSRHAVASWHLLENGGIWGPGDLRASAFLPDPAVPWRVAMPYALLEAHLLEEIARVEPRS